MSKLSTLQAELETHGKTCSCAHKKMCEDREEWLIKEVDLLSVKGLASVNAAFLENAERECDDLRAALQEIADPIGAMRARLQPDEQLDGMWAVALSSDPNYLKGIARKVLEKWPSA